MCLFFFNVCCLLQTFNYTSLLQSCDPLGDQGFTVTSMNKINYNFSWHSTHFLSITQAGRLNN